MAKAALEGAASGQGISQVGADITRLDVIEPALLERMAGSVVSEKLEALRDGIACVHQADRIRNTLFDKRLGIAVRHNRFSVR